MYVYVPIKREIPTKAGDEFMPNMNRWTGTLKGQDFMTFAAIKVLQAPFHRQQSRSLGHAGFTCLQHLSLGTFEASMACYIPMVGC